VGVRGKGTGERVRQRDLRVLVGVVLLAEFPVGRLDLLVVGLPVKTKNLVVVLRAESKLRKGQERQHGRLEEPHRGFLAAPSGQAVRLGCAFTCQLVGKTSDRN